MKVLLVATNQADRYMNTMTVRPVPIGLAYIAAALTEAGHEISVADLMFSEDGPADVIKAVREFSPELIGLSIRNLDNQSYFDPVWHLPAVKSTVDAIRSVTDVSIVCGGPAFSILPAECLSYVGADLGIAGDGAEAFAALADRLGEGEGYLDIPGLVHRDGDEVKVTEGRFSSDFRLSPRLDLLDMRRYDKAGFGVGVVTKLAQAYYPTGAGDKFNGSDWRIRPPEEVIDEVRNLGTEHGIKKVFFIDSGFNIPLGHAKELCRAIIGAGLGIRWNSYLRVGDCDDELLGLMKESGCSLALIADGGSTSDGFEQARALSAMCGRVGLPHTLAMTFGEPGDTEAGVKNKVRFLEEIDPAFVSLRVGNRVLPGTKVAQLAIEEGLIQSESDLIRPTFYVEPGVRDWIADYVRKISETHPRWHLL
ncbi:MAG: cobalamin-dependent protein [Chloroflexi bacterium]|nr:cobalamin-dependent protein [Chloroflexota bacterium]